MLAMLVVMLLPLAGLLFFFALPFRAALVLYLAGCVLSLLVHRLMHRTARLPVLTGTEGLIGRTASVVEWQGLRGTVRCHDELWAATSDQVLVAGDSAVIAAVHGLTLTVRTLARDGRGAPEGARISSVRRAAGHEGPAPRRRYDRLAPFYDLIDAPMDRLGGLVRRRRVLARAGGKVLEVGIGTGRNIGLYHPGVRLTGIDISERMITRARARSRARKVPVALVLGDIERLPFRDAAFDSVVATCVFCSVADPLRGFREVRRVVKPGGRILLLEHVRPEGRLLGRLFDLVTPLIRLVGPEVNRRTEDTARAAGLELASVRCEGIWREIEAVPGKPR